SYRLSAMCYVPSVGGPLPSEVTLHFAYYDDGAWVDVGEDSPTAQDEWQELDSGIFKIPLTATGIRAKFIIADTASDDEFFIFDDVVLRPFGVPNEHQNNFLDYGKGTIR
ncbi:hypothetical protein LCGC14_2398630, partial [marine sediment metagenome]